MYPFVNISTLTLATGLFPNLLHYRYVGTLITEKVSNRKWLYNVISLRGQVELKPGDKQQVVACNMNDHYVL